MRTLNSSQASSRDLSTRCLAPNQKQSASNASRTQSCQSAIHSRRDIGVALAVAVTSPCTLRTQAAESRLGVAEVKDRLEKCFVDAQYYVSGDLDRGIFDPNCQFTDPTIKVKGTEKYASAVASIFSPETAKADLIKCSIKDDNTIELLWRLEGVITQGGFQFKFKPYTGKTVYSLSNETGKIVRQDETWDISQLDVFVGLFFPKLGAPAAPPADELRQKYA